MNEMLIIIIGIGIFIGYLTNKMLDDYAEKETKKELGYGKDEFK